MNFWGWKIRYFLGQNVDANMIFIGYWEVLVLEFSEMGNTVFFETKKLVERWYLLITEKFLFWTFRGWEIRSFLWGENLMERLYLLVTEKFLIWAFGWEKIRSSLRQKVNGKMIFTDYRKVLVWATEKFLFWTF